MSKINFADPIKPPIYSSEPKIVGPYLLGNILGRGISGKVKEAICSETLKCLAIKVVKHQRARKLSGGIIGLTREIMLLRRIRHLNCVRLLDVYAKCQTNEETVYAPWFEGMQNIIKRYLVFEYCSTSLQTLLDVHKKLPMQQTQHYFHQLMTGIDYLHSNHIIHRDIKPANILLTSDHVVKISDFGVAELLSEYLQKQVCINYAGTPVYMSPEVMSGGEPDGDKVDLWALGITLFNMAFGKFPFCSSKSDLVNFYDKLHCSNLNFDNSPRELTNLLQKLLEIFPNDRISVAESLKHEYFFIRFQDGFVPLHSKNQVVLPFTLFPAIESLFPELKPRKKFFFNFFVK